MEGAMRPQKFRGNIFVANLPKGVTDGELAAAFEPYGIVIGAFIARDAVTGEPKNHGLVDIAPARAVGPAVAAMNGAVLGGRRIEAREADPTKALAVPTPGGRSRSAPSDDRPAATPTFRAPAEPRPAPTFQVEHRRLPRRAG
jgi:RNA recognition motif-containing protein